MDLGYRALIYVYNISFQQEENVSCHLSLFDFLKTMQLKMKCLNTTIIIHCKNPYATKWLHFYEMLCVNQTIIFQWKSIHLGVSDQL